MTSREKCEHCAGRGFRNFAADEVCQHCNGTGYKLPPGSPAGETASEPDDCEVCRGAKGGVKGNENVVDGKKVCDYCHAAAVPEPVPTEGLGDEAGCADIGYDGFFSRDIVAQSAAPIAPAAEEPDPVGEQMAREVYEGLLLRDAEELIQALEKALTELVDSIEDAGGHDEDGDVFDIRRACAALARAEEYRKGAKNA